MTDVPHRTELASADIQRVMQLLPHRYPFLLIDRIRDMVRDESAVGLKNVTINEPFFQGHFPGHPIMPGVLIVEAMAQAGGMLLMDNFDDPGSKVVYFAALDGVKFRRPVLPGDTIEYHMTKIARKRNMWWFRGEAKVAGHIVAEAEVGAMVP